MPLIEIDSLYGARAYLPARTHNYSLGNKPSIDKYRSPVS